MGRHATIAAATVLGLACGGGRDGDDSPFGSGGSASATSPSGTDESGIGDDDDSGTGAGPSSADDADTGADDGEDGIKLDVSANSDVAGICEGENCESCTYVDLLFVIDNSGSMGDYQNALALAFPDFATTLSETLPPGTNVHVGVTSTEMGYSSMGSTSITNGACSFIGDGNQPNTSFYVTPDESDSGRNGAQGRLYAPAGQDPYFEFTTGGDLTGLEAWFSAAATIGEGGSNIEMSAAPVGWVGDAANAATNDGFIRDEGAVLVVFFMQDEPDQTPMTIDGKAGGQFVLDRVAEAKAGCGGLACVIAGGFLNANACNADGNLPLDDFLAGVGETPIVQALPNENLAEDNPAAAAAEMNSLLSETLADVIAQTCDEVGPVG